MSTLAINSTSPSTAINLAVLMALIDRLLEAADKNAAPRLLSNDEYLLLNAIRWAVTTGTKTSGNTVSAVTMTY